MVCTGPYRGPLIGRIVVGSQACTGRVVAVSWHMGTVSQGACCAFRATPCCNLSDSIALLLRYIVEHARPYRIVVARHVAACLALHLAVRPPSCHDTPICIATHPPTARPCARAARLTRRPAVSQGLLAMLQRSAARQPSRVTPPVARPGLPPQPCVTIQFPVS